VPQPVSWKLPEQRAQRDPRRGEAGAGRGRAVRIRRGRAERAGGFVPEPHHGDDPLPDRTSPSRQALASGGSTGRPKLIVDALPAECDPTAPFYGNEPAASCSCRAAVPRGRVPQHEHHAPARRHGRAARALRPGRRARRDRALPRAVGVVRADDAAADLAPARAERTRYDVSSLVRVVSSAARVSGVADARADRLARPDRVFEAYGGTERIGGTLISGREWLEHPGSVGRPTGGRQIRILDENGRELPPARSARCS
jgi:bile acid-coenzyme A ligase